MNIKILDEVKLNNIPSGSGITKSGDHYYAIGDDSPFLFYLNSDFKTVSKTLLLESGPFSDQRIRKSQKPDFEAIELIEKDELVVFGSGSRSPQRNIFLRVFLKETLIVERFKLSNFYDNLKKLPEFRDSELNIEATAYRDNQLFLFNRKKNLVIRFEYTQFLAYIKGEIDFPKPKIVEFSLPKTNGIEAGFSGATAMESEPKIIFTASVENTENAYDDGDILGSFVGIIDIATMDSNSIDSCPIPNSGVPLKVESVTIEEEISPGKIKLVLITDDDKGNSIVLTGLLEW